MKKLKSIGHPPPPDGRILVCNTKKLLQMVHFLARNCGKCLPVDKCSIDPLLTIFIAPCVCVERERETKICGIPDNWFFLSGKHIF